MAKRRGNFSTEMAGVVECAGVRVSQAGAPAKSAAASSDGRAGGNDVIHKIDRQRLHRTGGSDDGVFVNGETRETAQAPARAGFYRMDSADGALDAGAGDQVGDGAGKCKVGGEAAGARGDRDQPARAV